MTPVGNNYCKILNHIHQIASRAGRNIDDITLVAVSKTYSWDEVSAAYDAGCLNFGENRVQEALPKIKSAPVDINWHLIGSLQKNKVRKAVAYFSLLHSVDSLPLAEKISDVSSEFNQKTPILLQVNVTGEKTKHGFSPNDLIKHFAQFKDLSYVRIDGLMTIAPFVDDDSLIRQTFRNLRLLRDELKSKGQYPQIPLTHLSMGMTGDYPIAIEEGATILRVGTAIFGAREYK